MNKAWTEVRLGDICAIKGGKRLPAGHTLVDQATSHPYIKARDIRHGRVSTSELQFLEPSTFEKIKRYTVNQGDVCITIVANIGDVGIVPAALDGASLTENAVKLTGFRSDVYPPFLAMQLSHQQFKSFMECLAAGAAQSKLGLYKIRIIKVRLPSPAAQRKIAAVLAAYDDLIEANRRRIALLERMADELYREWFVRLRFPGHAKTKIIKGLPAGWSPKPSNELFNLMSGGTPDTDNPVYWDGEIPFFTPKDAAENCYVLETEKTLTEKGLESCNSPLFPKGTLFITARGTVGKLAIAYRPMAMNQSCYALAPKMPGPVFWHYLALRNAIVYVKGVAQSGVFDNIVLDTFKVVPIFWPGEALVHEFNRIAVPMFEQVGVLLESNAHLQRTRDLLLPRLISGKLPVEALAIAFPPSMAEAAL